jgi:pseudouridine synthase
MPAPFLNGKKGLSVLLAVAGAWATAAWQPHLPRLQHGPGAASIVQAPPPPLAARRCRVHAGPLHMGSSGGGDSGAGARYQGPGFRVVKCFPQLARRQADQAVQDGRVMVNGEQAAPALRLRGGDILTLDGKRVEWEQLASASEQSNGGSYVYFKYHKPVDVSSSWDKNDRSSMLHFLPPDMLTRKGGGEGQAIMGKYPTKDPMEVRRQQDMGVYRQRRLFPVGRLDKDSTGLMLLTDDGRVVNALLQPKAAKDKEYLVEVDREVFPDTVAQLSAGVEITTAQQRGVEKAVTAKTLPCTVENLSNNRVEIEDDDADAAEWDGGEAVSHRGRGSFRGRRGARGGIGVRGGRGGGGVGGGGGGGGAVGAKCNRAERAGMS